MGYDVEKNDSPRCRHMQKLLISLIAATGVMLAGCGITSWPGVYKIDVQQGQPITQTLVDRLHPGMTRQQVSFVMGTPLLADPFHANRWDYVYTYQPGGGKREERRITVLFEADKLVRVEGDLQPSGKPQARTGPKETSVEVTGEPPPKSLLEKVKGAIGLGESDAPGEPERPIPSPGRPQSR